MQKCCWIGARASGSLTSDMGRVLGIGWMEQAWMMFSSSDSWANSHLFITGLPFFALWILVKHQCGWLLAKNVASTTAHTR